MPGFFLQTRRKSQALLARSTYPLYIYLYLFTFTLWALFNQVHSHFNGLPIKWDQAMMAGWKGFF